MNLVPGKLEEDAPIEVRLTLVGYLKKYDPSGAHTVSVQVGRAALVADVIRELSIDPGEVGLIMVDQRITGVDTPLTPGAAVKLYPLLSGG